MKKAEEYWNEMDFGDKTTNQYNGFLNAITKAQLDMLEYAVKKCAENADTKQKEIPYTGVRAGGSFYIDVVDEDSILKTINEIKKELK